MRGRRIRARLCNCPAGATSMLPTRETTAFRCTARPARASWPPLRRPMDCTRTRFTWLPAPMGLYVFVVTQGNGSSPGALDIINTTTEHHRRFRSAGSVSDLRLPRYRSEPPVRDQYRQQQVSVFDVSNVVLAANPADPDAGDGQCRFGSGVGHGPAEWAQRLRGEFHFQRRQRGERHQLERGRHRPGGTESRFSSPASRLRPRCTPRTPAAEPSASSTR